MAKACLLLWIGIFFLPFVLWYISPLSVLVFLVATPAYFVMVFANSPMFWIMLVAGGLAAYTALIRNFVGNARPSSWWLIAINLLGPVLVATPFHLGVLEFQWA